MKLNLKLTSLLLGTCVLAGPSASASDPHDHSDDVGDHHYVPYVGSFLDHSDDEDDSSDSDFSSDEDDSSDSDFSSDEDDSSDSGDSSIDGLLRTSFFKLHNYSRKALSCSDRDRYWNIGTVTQAPRKPEHQLNLEGEYRLGSGKEVNATKVLKIPRSELHGKVSAIATQCPHNSTALSNFFELICTSKINCLVVLGPTDPARLCNYWNPTASERQLSLDDRTIASDNCYYNIVSSRMISPQLGDYTVYELEIGEFRGGVRTANPSKIIKLYHYQQWPDHGVPTNIDNFYNFVDHIALLSGAGNNLKVLAHCSAGIGRTGTFLACLKSAIEQPTITIPPEAVTYAQDVVENLREHRSGMVQNLEQYKILYEFIIHQQLQRLY